MDLGKRGRVGVKWIDLAQKEVESCCECGNEPFGYIKCWETIEFRCEGRSNTSTVALRVVRGNKKGIRGYNWDTPFLGDTNTGTWPYRLGESQRRL
jgi:hypothetical protein